MSDSSMGPPAPDRMCPGYNICRDARDCFYQDKDGRLTDEGKRLQRLSGYCRLGRRTEYIKRHSLPHVADPLDGIYPDRLNKKYRH
jgi:hypothetical protein